MPNIFSSLVQFDTELGLLPDLAENWTVSEDGLNYSFKLRDGLTFHNGDPLKAADIVYTYERNIDPDFASPHANKLAQIEAVDTPDDLTVNLTLSAPFAPFLAVACGRGPGRAMTPISRRAFEEMGDEQFDQTPVGAGPFAIVADTADLSSGFELVAFDGWYGGRPLLDAIEVTLIAEPSSRISALEAGDVDMLDIVPRTGVAQLSENPDITLVQTPGTSWQGLAMNWARPPWDNPEARMAVAKAIDRDALIETAFFGLSYAGHRRHRSGLRLGLPAARGGATTPQAFNLDEAKALAESAGIVGAAPTIMVYRRRSALRRGAAEPVGRSWSRRPDRELAAGRLERALAGRRLRLDLQWQRCRRRSRRRPLELLHPGRPLELLQLQEPGGQRPVGRHALNRRPGGARRRSSSKSQAILQQDVPHAFIHHVIDITGFSNDVQGYVQLPEFRYLETVWLDR